MRTGCICRDPSPLLWGLEGVESPSILLEVKEPVHLAGLAVQGARLSSRPRPKTNNHVMLHFLARRVLPSLPASSLAMA